MPNTAPPREFLEHRVRIGNRTASGGHFCANDGLDRFSENFPVRVEVVRELRRIDRYFIETAQNIVQSENRVPESHPNVALGRRIGEIALQPGSDQRRGEGVEKRAGELEISFGVLEADRVDFMRHR